MPAPTGFQEQPDYGEHAVEQIIDLSRFRDGRLAYFSGEAYNVEQGVANELFPDARGAFQTRAVKVVPGLMSARPSPILATTNFESTQPQSITSDAIAFPNFMRFLAQPTPA